jgi:hypothetical protein
MRRLGLAPFWEDQHMSGEVPIEIEDKPAAVSIMRGLVERLQDTRPSRARGGFRATASSIPPEGLVQSGPLHEPDHLIDVRKLLAKSGSQSCADIRCIAIETMYPPR